ncbi:hypothetical protein SAMN05421751_11167 [Jhaorihella thermophila]|uniref:Uncharacterized protein n=1 Tax=Jhaorihella thermophila TaxID=488547 RepID=A0A1H5XKD1_9RHOB|nr:hypothetical protein SAMN05421751_11167 [Jhaorihella thermophila]
MGRETIVRVTQAGKTRLAAGLHPAEGLEDGG